MHELTKLLPGMPLCMHESYLGEQSLRRGLALRLQAERVSSLHSQDVLEHFNPFFQDVGRICSQVVRVLLGGQLEWKKEQPERHSRWLSPCPLNIITDRKANTTHPESPVPRDVDFFSHCVRMMTTELKTIYTRAWHCFTLLNLGCWLYIFNCHTSLCSPRCDRLLNKKTGDDDSQKVIRAKGDFSGQKWENEL